MKTGSSGMASHCARIAGITATIVFCTFYPFLPGEYDGLAVTLSAMAQWFGIAGLLLVPVGTLWLGYELRKQSRRKRNLSHKNRGYSFALASTLIGSIVAVAVSLGAFTSIGLSFGFAALALWAYAVSRLKLNLRLLKNTEAGNFHPAPLYLTSIPIAVLLFQVMLADAATEFSRNRAISNSAELIRDIEAYHATHGHYAQSLSSPTQDYKPSVIGIRQYHYAPHGDAYNLYFELPTFLFANPGTTEIVMYNKLDQHAMPSHDSDILRWTAEQLAARRGWYAVQDAASPHWKYFWFD